MRNTLLVEGNADKRVVEALREAHGLAESLFVVGEPCGSDNQALQKLNALIPAPNRPACIGLLLDMDQHTLTSRWQSIRNKLQNHPYQVPDVPVSTGTIIEATDPDFPRLGFWLMPNNQDPGMLEDFIQGMMPDICVQTIEQVLNQVQGSECATFKPVVQRSKALVHTYLAWQDEPGHPMGRAITAHVLQAETITARQFTDWLRRLFDF